MLRNSVSHRSGLSAHHAMWVGGSNPSAGPFATDLWGSSGHALINMRQARRRSRMRPIGQPVMRRASPLDSLFTVEPIVGFGWELDPCMPLESDL